MLQRTACVCLHCSLSLLLFISLRVSTVHHPTRKGWKGACVLALRGATTSTPSDRSRPPPPPLPRCSSRIRQTPKSEWKLAWPGRTSNVVVRVGALLGVWWLAGLGQSHQAKKLCVGVGFGVFGVWVRPERWIATSGAALHPGSVSKEVPPAGYVALFLNHIRIWRKMLPCTSLSEEGSGH